MNKYYKCEVCGNFIELLNDGSVPFDCCMKPMQEVTVNEIVEQKTIIDRKENDLIISLNYFKKDQINFNLLNFISIKTCCYSRKVKVKDFSDLKITLNEKENLCEILFYFSNIGLYKINFVNCCENNMKAFNEKLWFHSYPFFTKEKIDNIAKKLNIDFSICGFSKEEFWYGTCIELEHGIIEHDTNVTNDDPLISAKIALAHLRENVLYYHRNLGIAAWQAAIKKVEKNPNNKKIIIV